MRCLLVILVLLYTFAPVSAAPFAPEKGDRIVFIGDSITHQCKYTQYVENFLYTRYHDLQLRCFNAGIKGDKAADVLARFDEDVAFRKPQWTTLLLGMNDGGYAPYSDANFQLYQSKMSAVLDRFAGIKATPIVLTPTMFDHAQYNRRCQEPNFRFKRLKADPGYNAKLGKYRKWLQETAASRKLTVVDFWKAMNAFTAKGNRLTENFTLAPDAIHPNPDGMAIMAVHLATAMAGDRHQIPAIEIDLNGKHSDNVSQLKKSDDGITCTITPTYLPWVLPATDKIGPKPWQYKDNPTWGFREALIGTKLNDEVLKLSNLPEGDYEIVINGERIIAATAKELRRGINLSTHEKTATYQQSLALATLNAKRNDEAMRPYRDLQIRMKGARRKFAGKPAELQRFRQQLQPQLDKLLALADKYERQIHEHAVPRPYKLELIRRKPK